MCQRLLLFFLIAFAVTVHAQNETEQPKDTAKLKLNMDAVYDRPFLQLGKTPVAVGGYLEANTQYAQQDGVTEGLSFQMRRLTIFLSSSIYKKLKFLTEIEFEDGTQEINIEFASLDFEFHPLLNLRGGIVMNPIGAFNQNHDGPKWEFVDRPISATQMLPATWSNVGFGFHGRQYKSGWAFAYEAYLTNGFNEFIISNAENKTFLPAAKLNEDRFEESFNGTSLFTGKIAVKNRKVGELGISYMGGVYNKFEDDGLTLDKKRRADVFALDFNSTLSPTRTTFIGEWAWVWVDIPDTYTQQFGNKQHGGYVDIVQPVLRRSLLGFEKSVINLALRLEYVDWNVGNFKETGGNIYDHVVATVPAISWRPTAQTVLRFNYRYEWRTDLLGNPPSKTGVIQLGLSSYF